MLLTICLSLLLFSGCSVSETYNVALRNNIIKALSYHQEAMKISMSKLDQLLDAETKQYLKIQELGMEQNSFHMVQKLTGCTPDDKKVSYASFLQTEYISAIKKRFLLSDAELKQLLPYLPHMLPRKLHRDTRPLRSKASKAFQCPYPLRMTCPLRDYYRTYDGQCNNLQKPLWGSSHKPFARFLPPDYADGMTRRAISEPRVARSGKELPSARLVSSIVHPDTDDPDYLHTLILMVMGQFVDHDLSLLAISMIADSGFDDDLEVTEMADVECGDDGCQTDGPENRECYPIFVPHIDTVFGGHKRCLMFVRSLGVPSENCTPGPREQINQLTSFIDGSHIYGSTERVASELRELTADRGRMKVTSHPAGNFKPLLPQQLDSKDCPGADPSRNIFCFNAGDVRANEWSGLTTQHTIWVRQHNRIEEKLHELNPHWDGERLYQETRRIVVAVWQYFVYNEYLTAILGPSVMRAYGLQLVNTGFWNGYDTTVEPTITNSFATAAFRYGHTQIPSRIQGRDARYNVISHIPLSTLFFDPHILYEEPRQGMDMMILGMIGDSSQTVDPFLSDQITSSLFAENPPHGLGEDLAALNIQRGRDHGIPGYNYFRQWCGMKRAERFDDLVELPASVINRFRWLYEHVDDIDLWPAGVSELPTNGSMFGPTFTCIIARQFGLLKFGDRFWHENNFDNQYPFTAAQLAEIRKISYAKVLCENADHLPMIQPKVLFHPLSVVTEIAKNRPTKLNENEHIYGNNGNERVPCHELPDLDLRPWYSPYVGASPPAKTWTFTKQAGRKSL